MRMPTTKVIATNAAQAANRCCAGVMGVARCFWLARILPCAEGRRRGCVLQHIPAPGRPEKGWPSAVAHTHPRISALSTSTTKLPQTVLGRLNLPLFRGPRNKPDDEPDDDCGYADYAEHDQPMPDAEASHVSSRP